MAQLFLFRVADPVICLDRQQLHTVFKESLYQWAEEILKPTAELAFAGFGEFQCREWCQFCKAMKAYTRSYIYSQFLKLDF